MPEMGTKVSLYFPEEDEQSAYAINCVRHNGESCEGMADTQKRQLASKGGKALYLYPEEIGIKTAIAGLSGAIALNDINSIGTGQNVIAEKAFNGNLESYETACMAIDMLIIWIGKMNSFIY